MKPQRLLAAMLLATTVPLVADPAFAGRASGTIDGHDVDVELDCSGWQGAMMSATSTGPDADLLFDAMLFVEMNRLAITYKPEEKRYQLLFGIEEPGEKLEVASTFSNKATGDRYEAELSLDCSD
ncbi:hypothetical protein [Halomonas daqiaonensis]|uniref:Uncharacterized protein n=1 Tax=Halomonas daqiaonensis TaxID=650850 RepID=A0A1H7QXF4_9GAMM|nr:hypothetical protein [Halomonas daqiaonensis]SEL52325.1 hypothetical protein SAMN04488129_11175 [Halomonas daqiaonensis]